MVLYYPTDPLYTPPGLGLVKQNNEMKKKLLYLACVASLAIFASGLYLIADMIKKENDPMEYNVLYEYMEMESTSQLVLGAVIAILGLFGFLCTYFHPWPLKPKRLCVECNTNMTRSKTKAGAPTCQECKEKHDDANLIKEASLPSANCPLDNTLMEPFILYGSVVTNKCPHCKGVWIHEKGQEEMKKSVSRNKQSEKVFAMWMGIVLGMNIGIAGRH